MEAIHKVGDPIDPCRDDPAPVSRRSIVLFLLSGSLFLRKWIYNKERSCLTNQKRVDEKSERGTLN